MGTDVPGTHGCPCVRAQPAPARLVLINHGSQGAEIADLIRDLRLNDRTALLGRLSEGRLAEELQTATVYVSASLVDGVSVSMLQALATGLPIVATDTPCNRRWLDRVEGVRLVQADDESGWADAMSWGIALDPTRRQEIAGNTARSPNVKPTGGITPRRWWPRTSRCAGTGEGRPDDHRLIRYRRVVASIAGEARCRRSWR